MCMSDAKKVTMNEEAMLDFVADIFGLADSLQEEEEKEEVRRNGGFEVRAKNMLIISSAYHWQGGSKTSLFWLSFPDNILLCCRKML